MSNAERAIELIINYFEAEHIMIRTSEIEKNVNKWEKRLDPIDFISLAAISIENPNKFDFTIYEIRKIRDSFFL